MSRITLAAFLLCASAASLSAQRLGQAEQRPKLDAGMDTNSARSYYVYGLDNFEKQPDRAAAGFYWAARLDPSSGDPLYALANARLMRDPFLLKKVMRGDRGALESDEVRKLDSLRARALMLNPFLSDKLERSMFVAFIRKTVTDSHPTDNLPDLDFQIDRYIRSADDETRGWLASSDGDLAGALAMLGRALGSTRDRIGIHMQRARIFAALHQVDSATAEYKNAMDDMRQRDKKDLVRFYNSKALAEYSTAVLLEGDDKPAAAREAYGRALTEDLSYYPAHLRLGLLALSLKDTTTAMSELALAAQLAPAEPHIRYVNGYVLAVSKHYAEARKELEQAVKLEPYYALPYLRLGQVNERLQDVKGAADAYQNFVDKTAAADPARESAVEKLTDLKEMLAFKPSSP